MRVVSLLPAATEIVTALGGAGNLVGISHECDYPASVLGLPRVTATPIDVSAAGGIIDAEVRRLQAAGKPVIGVDAEVLRRLAPDVLITQALCEVCAVSGGEVHRLAESIRPAPAVVTLQGRTLEGVWADVAAVAQALDLAPEADELVAGLRSRLMRLRARAGESRPRVLCVEWLEPLFLAGHWVPEMIAAAGGEDVGARAGSHSARREWAELPGLRPDVVIVALCGFGVDRARRELAALADGPARSVLGAVPTWVLDGNAYTSRSGPRLVDGAELIQSALLGREPAAIGVNSVARWTHGA